MTQPVEATGDAARALPSLAVRNLLVVEPEGAPRFRFLRRFLHQRAGVLALICLVIVTLAAAFAPLIAPYSPTAAVLRDALQGPSRAHWLGTDDLGRDVLSRMLFGARISLAAAVIAVSIALVLGLPFGLISGHLGGRWDNMIMRVNDALMSFPPLILAVTIIGFLGPSLTTAMTAIGLVYAPRFMRVVRAAALNIRSETYIEAARMIGSPGGRTVRRHVLPNILSPVVVEVSLAMGFAILAEASLSFIGLGVQPPQASLGAMLGDAFTYLDRAPVFALAPGFVIVLIVLGFNVLGDGLRDSLGRETRRVS